ncbi:MAG: beta-lactamase family protein [Gemmatimonadota bacterium]|nr:MAG: beta-lactamase family protein [Gemmatimonadota bacterium]
MNMNAWKLAGVVGLAVLSVECCSDATGANNSPIVVSHMEGLTGFEAQLDSLRVELHTPAFGAAIVEDGQIAWSMGFGFADVDEGRRATGATSFHLASLTKPFASTIVMQLVDEGLVDLDDPVSDYGVDLTADGTVRVRHLLNHTSEGVPGTAYRYNGGRFGELDQVISSATGRSFGQLLVQEILQPLQLRHTAPNVRSADFTLAGLDREAFIANMASPYEWEDSRVVRASYPRYFGTAAGLIASAEDVARYSIAIDQGMFLEPATWDSVFTPAKDPSGNVLPYALGWFIHMHEGIELQWHYGYWEANSSLIVRVPERGLAFVVLANTSMLSRPYGLGIDSDVLRSDVARLFIESFVTGTEPLPRN